MSSNETSSLDGHDTCRVSPIQNPEHIDINHLFPEDRAISLPDSNEDSIDSLSAGQGSRNESNEVRIEAQLDTTCEYDPSDPNEINQPPIAQISSARRRQTLRDSWQEIDQYARYVQFRNSTIVYAANTLLQQPDDPSDSTPNYEPQLMSDEDVAALRAASEQLDDSSNATPEGQPSNSTDIAAAGTLVQLRGSSNTFGGTSAYQYAVTAQPDIDTYHLPLRGIQSFASTPAGLSGFDIPVSNTPDPVALRTAYSQFVQQPPDGNVAAKAGSEEPSPEPSSEQDGSREQTSSTSTRRSAASQPRQARTRVPPRRSDAPPHLPWNHPDTQLVHKIDASQDSGRNLLALFNNEGVARTRYRLQIERGRVGNHASRDYPESHQIVPSRMTLSDICRQYPNHVWGSGLRMFMHEGWSADQIWKDLPEGVRQHGCKTRPHNYLQQAIGRENDKMYEDAHGGEKRVARKRKRKDSKEAKPKTEKKTDKKPQTPKTILPRAESLPAQQQLTGASSAVPQSGPALTVPGLTYSLPGDYQTGYAGYAPRGYAQPGRSYSLFPPTVVTTPAPVAPVGPPQPQQTAMRPRRTAGELQELVFTELRSQDALVQQILAITGQTISIEEARRRRLATYARMLRDEFRLSRDPVEEGSVLGFIQWILLNRANVRGHAAEPVALNDLSSRALSWYLWFLRGSTRGLANELERQRQQAYRRFCAEVGVGAGTGGQEGSS